MIVAISVTDLMEASEEQLESYAKRLRARIDEVTNRLQMVVPIYVMFTKVDLVAGFVAERGAGELPRVLGAGQGDAPLLCRDPDVVVLGRLDAVARPGGVGSAAGEEGDEEGAHGSHQSLHVGLTFDK